MRPRIPGLRLVVGLTALVAVSGATLSVAAAAALAAGQRHDVAWQFDRRARQVQEAVTAEAGRYVDTLRTVAAAAGAFDELTAGKFRAFTEPLASMRLAGVSSLAYLVPASPSRIPAVQAYWRSRGATGLVLAAVGSAPEHIFAVLSTSLDGQNPSGAGLDASQAPAPTAALNEARRSGRPTVSDAYQLLRDAHLPASGRQMSFVLTAPVFGRAGGPDRQAFRGWVVMGLRGQNFASAALQRVSQQLLDITLRAFDSDQNRIEVGALTAPVPGRRDLRLDLGVPVADRRWQLHVSARGSALPGAGAGMPTIVASGGSTVSGLLAALVWVLATGRRRARAQVRTATAGLAAAELTARRHADLLDAVLNSVSDGVAVVNEDGEFILHNPAARQLTGLEINRPGPQNWQSHYGLFLPDGVTPLPVEQMPLVRALAGEHTSAVEIVIRNAGQPRGVTISASARPLTGAAGVPVGAVAVFHDITDQKASQDQYAANAEALRRELVSQEATEAELRQAHDELAAQQAYLTQVLDALEPSVLTCDSDGVIVHANRAAHTATDTPTVAERAAARRFQHPDGRTVDPGELPLMRSLRGEQVDHMEVTALRPDGSRQVMLLHSRPLRHADGHITGAVASVYDITELRERENELRAFAGVVAHDLRSPLAAIAGHTEALRADLDDDLPPAHLRPSLERVQAAVTRMGTLIDDLLAYATARDAALDRQPVDLGAVVADVLRERTAHLRSTTAGQKAVPFPDIYTGPLPTVHADHGMIRQLIDNLVGNALKYTLPGQPAHIDISAHQRDGDAEWTITIADRGIGIPAQDQPHIFNSFHRAAAHRAYQGTGLGLAICERIVTRHGGTIKATDNPGGGTRFRFTLPAAEPGSGPPPNQPAGTPGQLREHPSPKT